MKLKKSRYERKAIYPVDAVFKALGEVGFQGRLRFHGDRINADSLRYKVFAQSLICPVCGLKGSFFAKERTKGSTLNHWHLNLYAINDQGKEVLMTKDHIHPVSLGGTDDLSNLRTMCEKCNGKKGNKIVS